MPFGFVCCSGEAIVAGDRPAIKSLLEVFKWLFEYILERIGNDSLSSFPGQCAVAV